MWSCLENDAELQKTCNKTDSKREIHKNKETMTFLKDRLQENQRYALDLAAEKGVSSWLNTLPLKLYHFDLTKTELRDGSALRYG